MRLQAVQQIAPEACPGLDRIPRLEDRSPLAAHPLPPFPIPRQLQDGLLRHSVAVSAR